MFTAAILAGGHATRLGGVDKSALTVGSQSILSRQLALLHELTTSIFIVAGDATRFSSANVPVIRDLVVDAGALGGLYTALEAASSESVLVIACDMPFLTAPFLACLVAELGDADAVVPRDARGRHPLCAAYARRAAPYLKTRIDAGDLRIGRALEGLAVREFGPDRLAALDQTGRLLVNVNSPEDYETARAIASTQGSTGPVDS